MPIPFTAFLVCLALQAAAPPKVGFEDKHLATIPEGVTAKDIQFSPDGKQVAYRALYNGKTYIVVNNQKGAEYAGVESLRWSPDGRVCYRAYNGTGWMVVVGTTTTPASSMVGIPVFSPDGKKFAYEVNRGVSAANDMTSAWVVSAGKKGAEYAAAGSPVWSGDGSITGYTVRVGKAGTASVAFHTKHAVVIGEKLSPEYDETAKPVFSPKGTRYAYRAKSDMTWSMIVDGKSMGSAAQVGEPVWSPSGTSLAWRTEKGGKWAACVDGKVGQEYRSLGELVWSPDSKQLAYSFVDGDKWGIMQGERPAADRFVAVGVPVWAPVGESVAFAYRELDGRWGVVAGDKRGAAEYDQIQSPVWSPDGKHIAFAATWKFRFIVVKDDIKAEQFDAVGAPVWSPDSAKIAFSAKKEGKWYICIDHRRNEVFDEILTRPYFSPDSKQLAFGARKGQDIVWRVMGTE